MVKVLIIALFLIIFFEIVFRVIYSIKNPITYIENNIISYINLLEFFKKESKPKLIIYASSSSIYGEIGSKKSNSSICEIFWVKT